MMAVASKMHGPARHWWDTQEVTMKWEQVMEELPKNFTSQYNEMAIHQQLSQRTRKPNESMENYCFEMNMIGKKINLSNDTIIQYILTGVNDTQMSANLATGNFKSIAELVEKAKWITNIRANLHHKPTERNNWQTRQSRPLATHNSNVQSSSTWTNRNKNNSNIKCYICQKMGHYARDCVERQKRRWADTKDGKHRTTHPETKVEDRLTDKKFRVNRITKTDCYHKIIMINAKQYVALLDSGSEKTIIAETIAKEIGMPIKKENIVLHGFGGGNCQTIGSMCCTLQVDGAEFNVQSIIVDDKNLAEAVLIGRDILNLPECKVINNGCTLTIKRQEQTHCEEVNNICISDHKQYRAIITGDIDNNGMNGEIKDRLLTLLNTYRKGTL